MKQRVIGILTTLIMVITMVVFAPMSIFAASGGDSIPYIDIGITDEATGAIKTVQSQLTGTYSTISQTDTVWGEDGADTWLVLDEDITLVNCPEVRGNVHLILLNGKTLTANQGITVETGNSIMIYAQSDKESEMGTLRIKTVGHHHPAIGGRRGQKGSDPDGKDCGTVCFYGGNISLESGEVCIGGGSGAESGNGGDGGTVCFYGGNIALKSSYYSCIGGSTGEPEQSKDGHGGNGGDGGTVRFYGGTITLTSNKSCIGGGDGVNGTEVNFIGGKGGNGGSNLFVSVYGGSIRFKSSGSCISGGKGGTGAVADGEPGNGGIGGDLNADAFKMYGGDITVIGASSFLSAGNGGIAGSLSGRPSFVNGGAGGNIKSGAIGFYGGTLAVESTDACIRAGNGGIARYEKDPSGAGTGGKGGSVESDAIIFKGGTVTLNSTTEACIRAGIGGMGQIRAANGKLANGYMTVSDSAVMKAGDNADSAETVSEYNGQKYLSVSYNPSDNGDDDPVNPFNPGDHTHSGSLQRGVTPSGKNLKYYKCDCGKYFEDSACTKEISDLKAWLAKDDSEDKSGTIIQTGDTSNMTPWIVLMIVSLMGIAVCIISIKRKVE